MKRTITATLSLASWLLQYSHALVQAICYDSILMIINHIPLLKIILYFNDLEVQSRAAVGYSQVPG